MNKLELERLEQRLERLEKQVVVLRKTVLTIAREPIIIERVSLKDLPKGRQKLVRKVMEDIRKGRAESWKSWEELKREL